MITKIIKGAVSIKPGEIGKELTLAAISALGFYAFTRWLKNRNKDNG